MDGEKMTASRVTYSSTRDINCDGLHTFTSTSHTDCKKARDEASEECCNAAFAERDHRPRRDRAGKLIQGGKQTMAAPLGFVRRLRALQRIVPPKAARAVTFSLLLRLTKAISPKLRRPRYRCVIPPKARASIDAVGEFISVQPLQEAAYYLSCVYAVLCDPADRRELAMYFTPPSLARHIIESAAQAAGSLSHLRFMDPACGGAAFLLPTVMTLRDTLRARGASAHDIVRAINRQILGIEKDGTLAELSRQFIRLALADELVASGLALGPIIKVGDALHLFAQHQLPRVNILLCNPPYRKIGASELIWYRKRFPEMISGQPNLYTMFMRVAADIVIPGGLMALLTPTSYFSGPTYEPIRRRLGRRCALLRIDLIHERDNFFLGVEHDVGALLARSRLSSPVRQTPEVFAWDEHNGWSTLGPISVPKDGRPWHLPRDASTARALITSRTATGSLTQYGYKARVGVYVWNRDERRPRKARPHGRDRDRAVPVIWATQIGQDGIFRHICKSAKEKRARFILLRPNDRRGVVEQDAVVLQRTSSRAQSRRLVAAALPRGFAQKYRGFVAENHVIILEPTVSRPLISQRTLVRLLNSAFMRDLYSTTTGTTAVTISGLHSLPLPDANVLKTLLKQHRDIGQAIPNAFAPLGTLGRGRHASAQATAS